MTNHLFILDTNVLMHDPTAIFRFSEHAIYLPMVVLEELDAAKKGMSEVARNVRQVSRFLDELIAKHVGDIKEGISLPATEHTLSGRLFFQTEVIPSTLLPDTLPGNKSDNSLLSTAIALQQLDLNRKVTLISKDINLRIKAYALGIHTEDYSNDKVLDDVDLLYTGQYPLDANFWETHAKELTNWQGRTFYKITGPLTAQWYPNQLLYHANDDGFEAIVRECQENSVIIERIKDFRTAKNQVWGISARNREQNFALNLLTDPEVDFVTLLGAAGTGKTLLTLAAGLAQTLEKQLYREIIVTRVTVPLGEDIGFLPGTEEEKMTPWMGHLWIIWKCSIPCQPVNGNVQPRLIY